MSRNLNLDFLKIILSLFVIAAHVFPTHEINGEKNFAFFQIQGLARLTVPLFFIITGYFINFKINDVTYLKKTLKRLFIIYIVWQLIYSKTMIDFYLNDAISFNHFITDLIYGIAHLWYLFATILGIILLYFTRNLSSSTKITIAFSLLIIGYILQYLTSQQLIDKDSVFYKFYLIIGKSRNFLFYAYPYLLLGSYYNKWNSITSKYSYFIYILFIILSIETEYYRGLNTSIFNIFITPFLLTLFIFDFVLKSKKSVRLKFPSTLSLGIYLIHFYVVLIVFQKYPTDTVLAYIIKYFIICCLTIIIWYIMDKLNKKIAVFF